MEIIYNVSMTDLLEKEEMVRVKKQD